MYFLDKERAIHNLKLEKITDEKINYFLDNYPVIDDKLGTVLEQWMNGQPITDVEIDGIILSEVMQKRQAHLLSAIRDMNKLLDPALSPETKAQWHRILSRPVYFE
jgi:glutamate mutase epsilon subunit